MNRLLTGIFRRNADGLDSAAGKRLEAQQPATAGTPSIQANNSTYSDISTKPQMGPAIDTRHLKELDLYVEKVTKQLRKGKRPTSKSSQSSKTPDWKSYRVDLETLNAQLSPELLSSKLLEKIFQVYVQTDEKTIELRQFFVGLSACCGGSTDDKLIYCFSLYDDDNDGKLSQEELVAMMSALSKLRDIHKRLIKSHSTLLTLSRVPKNESKSAQLVEETHSRETEPAPVAEVTDTSLQKSSLTPPTTASMQQVSAETTQQSASSADSADSPTRESPTKQFRALETANRFLKSYSQSLDLAPKVSAATEPVPLDERSQSKMPLHSSKPNLQINTALELRPDELPSAMLALGTVRAIGSMSSLNGQDAADDENKRVRSATVRSNRWLTPIEDATELVKTFYATMELEPADPVGLNDYLQWIHRNPSAISFLDKVKHIATVTDYSRRTKHMSDEEREIIQNFQQHSQWVPGDECYLVSMKWWRLWTEYVGLRSNRTSKMYSDMTQITADTSDIDLPPNSIDNLDLVTSKESEVAEIAEFPLLRDNLVEGVDFLAVTQPMWTALLSWYGGGPTIARQIVSRQIASRKASLSGSALEHGQQLPGSTQIDLYPVILGLGFYKDQKVVSRCLCSLETTAAELKILVCRQLNIPLAADLKFWIFFPETEPILIEHNDSVLRELGLTIGHCIFVDGKIKTVERAGSSFSHWFSRPQTPAVPLSPTVPSTGQGLVGLQNLGNTCYMNAALQCLVHSKPLVDYFTDELYQDDFDPRESDGSVTQEFARFTQQFWQHRNYSYIVPQNLRTALIKRCPQFSGYEQHDSQELLGLVLDNLHMDLNLIKQKVTKENPDYKGHKDEELANIYWMNHLRRDASLIVSLFEGQFKTHLQCLTCKHEIVKYHPFMFLSLPLPESHQRTFQITIIRSSPHKLPLSCKVTVDRSGDAGAIIDALKPILGPESDEHAFWLADVQSNYIFSFLRRTRPLDEIRERDIIYAYEIDPDTVEMKHQTPTDPAAEVEEEFTKLKITLLHRKIKGEWTIQGRRPKFVLYGIPLVIYRHIYGSGRLSGRDIYELITDRLKDTFNVSSAIKELVSARSTKPPQTPTSQSPPAPTISSRPAKQLTPTPDWPFVLKFVNNNGSICSRCTQDIYSAQLQCTGCIVPMSDDELILNESECIAIEWQSKKNLLSGPDWTKIMSQVEEHPSLKTSDSLNGNVTLDEIIQEYEKPEFMSQDDFYCPNCKCAREGVKRETIWRYPPLLMIQLKRFSYTMNGSIKNDRMVNFPQNDLNLSPYVTPNAEGKHKNLLEILPQIRRDNTHRPFPPEKRVNFDAQYDLYAIISHFGVFSDGHYVAYWRDIQRQKWYFFNDHQCRDVQFDETDIPSQQAYVLFYQLKQIPDISTLRKQPLTMLKQLEDKYGNYDQQSCNKT